MKQLAEELDCDSLNVTPHLGYSPHKVVTETEGKHTWSIRTSSYTVILSRSVEQVAISQYMKNIFKPPILAEVEADTM